MPFKVLPFAYSEMTEFKLLKDNLLGRTSKTFMLGLVILREGFLPPPSAPSNHSDTFGANGSFACGNWVPDVQVSSGVFTHSYIMKRIANNDLKQDLNS